MRISRTIMSEAMAAIFASRQSPPRRAIKTMLVVPTPSSTNSRPKIALRHFFIRSRESEVWSLESEAEELFSVFDSRLSTPDLQRHADRLHNLPEHSFGLFAATQG